MAGWGAAALAAAAVASGCADAPATAVTECEAEIGIGAVATDIVFVVDDSLSMAEEQENLRQNLATFVDLLAAAPVQNDFRIGVTNTSVTGYGGETAYDAGPNAGPPAVPYPAGALVAIARDGAGAALAGTLVYDATGGVFGGARVLDAGSATLVDDFKANVLQGVAGSGKEQPFAAIQGALAASVAGGVNAGFLRPGARLAVVILTDEDDCTDPAGVAATNTACQDTDVKAQLLPVGDVVSFLQGPLDGELRDPIVAVIAGFDPASATLEPTGCATSFADPTRLDALVAALGPERAFKDSICDPDFGPGLQAIADLLVPQTVPLENAPSDLRMLVVSVEKPDGSVTGCPIAAAGTPEAAAAGAVYTPPGADGPATLTFQGACRLRASDRLDVRIVCAG